MGKSDRTMTYDGEREQTDLSFFTLKEKKWVVGKESMSRTGH